MKNVVGLLLVLCLMVAMCAGCAGEDGVSSTSAARSTTTVATDPLVSNSETTLKTGETTATTAKDGPAVAPTQDLTKQQMNSLAMLNYLAMVSQKIESSKNNRIYLEEVYSSLLNNTNPDINKETQDYIQTMLSIIKDYRQIELKRERLQYIYEQDKANSVKTAMPGPLAVFNVVQSFDWKKLATSVLYTAASSYTNYKSADDSLDKQFVLDGWELDDEEAENIHKNKTKTFNYMVSVVREYNLPNYLALNEDSVSEFVEAIANPNNNQKLQFLKSHKEIYAAFGPYWLEMAKCYYELEDYPNCLACLSNYEVLDIDIFRYDYQYSEFLPMAIVAAQSVYKGDSTKYVKTIEKYTETLRSPYQTKWELKYFAAQSYMDLYTKTKQGDYLKKAYEIAKDNVNSLAIEQESLNKTYLNDVQDLTISESDIKLLSKLLSKGEIKAQQKKLAKLNKSLKEKRETELPELYEPLVVNCELLFALADELKIDDKEKSEINGILSGVFIVDPVADKYSFNTSPSYSIDFVEDEIVVPANLLADSAKITAVINSNDKEKITDFALDKVARTGETVSSFKAHYKSKTLKSIDWKVGDTVTVAVSNGQNYDDVTFTFKVKDIKAGVWDFVKGVFGSDKVIFECVG